MLLNCSDFYKKKKTQKMEGVVVKKEEPDTSYSVPSLKEQRSWRKQDQVHMSSLPAKITTTLGTGKHSTAAPQNSNSTSQERQRSLLPGHNVAAAVSKHKKSSSSSASTNNAYSLGTRCGEIFVVNNAKQWTFVCTFCNKSTRDIGDFICHIKIKHLEESDVPQHPQQQQYGSDYYGDSPDEDENGDGDGDGDDDDDDDASAQAQDYLDCGSYLDINVHTDPEELNYSNGGDKYAEKYEAQQQIQAAKLQNRTNDNNWLNPKQYKQQQRDQKPSQQARKQLVQLLDDSDNDIEDVLQTHTSHRKQSKRALKQLQQQQQALDNAKKRNGANEASRGSTMDVDDEEGQADYADDYGDDDFDNQLLLAPTDSFESTTPSSDGKIKRRQIRGTAYCALCNKTFQYYSLYRNHMIKHSNETPFKCNICQKGFKSKQAIRYHMNTHQKETKFKCEICDAGFFTENQFITHVLTHENANTFPCMVCGKVLHSDKERDMHLTTHTEERPFRCEFCQKLFRLRHHLSNHLKMHRQYRCEYCREEFTSAVHLRKPYACPVCENTPEARSASENAQQHVNPMQLFEAVMPPTQPTECVDLAEMVSDSDTAENEEDDEREEDDDEDDDDTMDEPSSSSQPGSNRKKPFPCKHCPRAYSHLSGLNYHIRTKH